MSKATDYGVQSYCFRHFKENARVAEMVREIGLDKIEVCAVHADLKDPDGFSKVVDTYRDGGVSVVSVGVETFTGDPDQERVFQCAQVAGAKVLSCHFAPDSFFTAIPQVREWSRKYGIRVGIHCHGGYAFGGDVGTLKYLVSLGTPEIGVCLDSAWAMQIGPGQGDPVKWVREHFDGKIYGIHYKDFVFERNGMWKDVVVGDGNLDLPAFVKALDETGFDGMAVIEYEADVENPVPALKKCVESMRRSAGR